MYVFALQSRKFHALKEIVKAKKEGKWPQKVLGMVAGGIRH